MAACISLAIATGAMRSARPCTTSVGWEISPSRPVRSNRLVASNCARCACRGCGSWPRRTGRREIAMPARTRQRPLAARGPVETSTR